WLDGYDLMNVPLQERKALLKSILPGEGMLRMSESFEASGEEVYAQAEKMHLEGIVAKNGDSIYKPAIRSKDWLKIKTQKQQEAVIAGYTRNENTRKKFSALLMGVYENDTLVFIGPVGTGFDTRMQTELLKKLKPLETKRCPFAEVPDYNKPSRFRPNPPKAEVVWVKPEIVAEVSYRATTADGAMRHPSFKGLREDKNPREVVREKPVDTQAVVDSNDSPIRNKVMKPPKKGER